MKNLFVISKNSIRSKMLAAFLVSSILIFIIVLSIVAIRTNRIVKEDAEKLTDNYAREYAALSTNNLNEYMDAVRLLSQQFENFEQIDENKRREYYNNNLINLLKKNDSFLSLWTIWEPHTIDNRDNFFKWKPGSTVLGNYSPTYFKVDGKVFLEANNTDTLTTPLFSSEYFTLPKKRRKETILNPYYYAYSGIKKDEIYQTNLIVPIIVREKFMGVVGVDVPLSTLQIMIDSIKPFENSYALLATNDGILVTHPDTKMVGTSATKIFKDISLEGDILENIEKGRDFSFTYSQDGETYYVSFSPVDVGNTETPWSIGIAVPYNIIMTQAYNQLMLTIGLAIIGLILITVVSIFIANRIADPLKKGTAILNDLAIGKLRKKMNLNTDSQDELGEMARALIQLSSSISKNTDFATQIGSGTFDSEYVPSGSDDLLGNALLKMQQNLKKYSKDQEKNNWIQSSAVSMGDILRGEKTLEELATEVLSLLGKITDMRVGTIYYKVENDKLDLIGAFCFDNRRASSLSFKIGEGIVGQSVKEKRTLIFSEVPENYMTLQSGLGKTVLDQILVMPFIFNNEVIGALEIGFSAVIPDIQKEFLERMNESIAIGFKSIKDREEMNKLLNKTLEQSEAMQEQQIELQQQNEELTAQQDELRKSNSDLEVKSLELEKSESNLQTQQEELRVINEELEEKTKSLEIESKRVSEQNSALEVIKFDLEKKAAELEASSTYKSEFLANMSHELRTPLNSLLILSKNLSTSSNNNFDKDQIESLDIIYNSGKDLLKLINDILDLSKIESGKMVMNYAHFTPDEIKASLQQGFQHMADEKKLDFHVNVSEDFPEKIYTDFQRLGQVLKNLTSNAIKFTQNGTVTINLFKPDKKQEYLNENLYQHDMIGISVIDTGIGISQEKIDLIFEAFKQADGSTSRNYGGTGLGLSISKELTKLMGGEIQLKSTLGKGSVFTLFIPVTSIENKGSKAKSEQKASKKSDHGITPNDQIKQTIYTDIEQPTIQISQIADDRDIINKNDHAILIIEDDVHFARILQKQAKKSGFSTLVATRGSEGLALAQEYLPSAIILDIRLPDINGMKILDSLKQNSDTRHIPVHMMSAHDSSIDASEKGAIGFTIKPVSSEQLTDAFDKIETFIQKEMRELLIVEDDAKLRKSIRKLIGEKGIKITEAVTGNETLKKLKEKHFDCMILDLGLPDMTGFELLKKIEKNKMTAIPPVIVYTGKELTKDENEELALYSNSIIIKGVKSADRLLDETALFMHRVVRELPEQQQNIITSLHGKDKIFKNKKVLIVDDDMRNVFALSKVLTEKDITVLKAENGKIGIERLKTNPDIDLVLMDIMMPVMDGYESMKEIRKIERFKELPIIALTAKAMKNDAEKCMNAGANEYLSKPLDAERLFTLMRVWLYKN